MSNNESLYEIDIRKIFVILLKHKYIIFGVTILATVMAIIFLFLQVPRYTATTNLLIDVRNKNVVDIESVVSGITSDDAAIESELDLLRSRQLVAKVVDTLDLTTNDEFNPALNGPSLVSQLKSLILSPPEIDEKEQQRRERSIVIGNVKERFGIGRKRQSYTITISFTSEDPKLAALIANTMAEEYLNYQLSVKFEATQQANLWLNDKLNNLKKRVRESELAVEMFKEKFDLIESDGRTLNDQQLSELNSQLILARTERAQAQSRLRITNDAINSSSEVLDSRLIQSLRSQEAEVLRKKSDLQGRYGSKHPKMINVHRELRDLRDKIKIEIQKIMNSLENEVQIALSREEALEESLDQLTNKAQTSNVARVQLDELVRERNSNQSLYEAFLVRFKEVGENLDLQKADARIITEAEEPLKPSSPRTKLILMMALVAGAMLGVLIAFIMEKLDNAFRSIEELEEYLGVAGLGIIPHIGKEASFIDYLVKKPNSFFAESLRSVLTSLRLSNPDKPPKTVMVTSSTHSEGKSSFCISLASVMASAGHKVLLVDCDLKRPSIAKKLDIKNDTGLTDLLVGDVNARQVISRYGKKGFYVISNSRSNISNSQDLLGSRKMEQFIEQMKAEFDLVILDTPPVLPVSDAIVVSRFSDACLFMTLWQKTPRQMADSAIKQLKSCNVNVTGTLLTQVDMDKKDLLGYGTKGYYYGSYSKYYTE